MEYTKRVSSGGGTEKSLEPKQDKELGNKVDLGTKLSEEELAKQLQEIESGDFPLLTGETAVEAKQRVEDQGREPLFGEDNLPDKLEVTDELINNIETKGKLLGSGAFGSVYLHEGAAYKVFPRIFKGPSESLLRQEIKAAEMQNEVAKSGLAPKVESIGKSDIDRVVIKMEALEGFKPIKSLIKEGNEEGLDAEIEGVLSKLKESSIIHNDLHTDNLMKNEETGEFKVIDFGLSQKVEGDFDDSLDRKRINEEILKVRNND